MRFLLTIFTISFLFSCSTTPGNVAFKEEESLIKSILKPLAVKGVEIKEVKATDGSPFKDFTQFEVVLVDKRRNQLVKKYIWVSKDGNYLILDAFKIRKEADRVSLVPVKPKDSEVPLKQDLSWVEKIDEKLTKMNIPHVIGNGENIVYIVWDVYCPFCYKHFGEIVKKAKELNLQVHLIPLAVHGKSSLEGFVYFTKLAREKGMEKTFQYLLKKGEGDFLKYAKTFEEETKKNLNSVPAEERESLMEFYKDLRNSLISHNITATPTVIFIPKGETQGYVYVGFKPLEEVIKKK
ncbi:MAG: DsbA family protein [Desulfurobacteriaceae bacterium]